MRNDARQEFDPCRTLKDKHNQMKTENSNGTQGPARQVDELIGFPNERSAASSGKKQVNSYRARSTAFNPLWALAGRAAIFDSTAQTGRAKS